MCARACACGIPLWGLWPLTTWCGVTSVVTLCQGGMPPSANCAACGTALAAAMSSGRGCGAGIAAHEAKSVMHQCLSNKSRVPWRLKQMNVCNVIMCNYVCNIIIIFCASNKPSQTYKSYNNYNYFLRFLNTIIIQTCNNIILLTMLCVIGCNYVCKPVPT